MSITPIFVIWMLLLFLQGWVQRNLSPGTSKMLQTGAIVAALIGLYFTYQDFRHTISHRWLDERFHIGGYLFWIGWIIISVFYLTQKRNIILPMERVPDKDRLPAPGDNNND